MTAAGSTQDQICKIIGISDITLRKHYRHEIDVGAAEANANVARNIYNRAIGKGPDAVPAGKFWLCSRARDVWGEGGDPQDAQKRIPDIHVHFPDAKKKDDEGE